jgi:hypothetical protein
MPSLGCVSRFPPRSERDDVRQAANAVHHQRATIAGIRERVGDLEQAIRELDQLTAPPADAETEETEETADAV